MFPFEDALLFLSQFVFTVLIFVLLLRFCLQLSGASTHNVITQWVIKITRPVVKPFQWILPTFRRFDTAVILLAFALTMLKVFIYGFLKVGMEFSWSLIAIFSGAQLLQFIVQLYSIAIIAEAVLSWVKPEPNGLTNVLHVLTAPLLRLVRRFVPPLGGFDLSPVVVWTGLQLVNMIIITPVMRHFLWMI